MKWPIHHARDMLPSELTEALKAAVLFLSLGLFFVIFTVIADQIAKRQYSAVITSVEKDLLASTYNEREI